MSWDPSMEWNGREYAHPTGERLASQGERGIYGVKGELAARLLPPLIELAKSRDQQKLRKLLCHQIEDRVLFWRAHTNAEDSPLTSALHWQLYEALATNPKLTAVLEKMSTNNAGKRPRFEYNTWRKAQRIPGWQEYPNRQVAHAERALISLARAARHWCYRTDDVEKFALVAREQLFVGEMQLSVSEMFFDMPRYGTGQVAQWWWDAHQCYGSQDLVHFPTDSLDPFGGLYENKHWCVLRMRRQGFCDWDGYDHGTWGMVQERVDAQRGESRTIFQQLPFYAGDDVHDPQVESLYELGVDTCTCRLQAPPFDGLEGKIGRLCTGLWGSKWHPEPNKCGRKCLDLFLPSFGFWFALGLPRSLLVREDRMVYRWWLVSRLFKRELFKAMLAKVRVRVDEALLAPGGAYYNEQALNSAAAQSMRGADQGTGVLARLWNHEDKEHLPSDPTGLLKCIGWRLAQRMNDVAVSSSMDMHKELSAKTRGERGQVELDAHSLQVCRTEDFPTSGWCLSRVVHMEANQYTCTGKYEYVYAGKRGGKAFDSVVELSQRGGSYTYANPNQRGGSYTYASFVVKNVTFYYYSSKDVSAVFLDRDWSLHVSSQMRRMPRNDHYLIESVSWKAAAATYVCYDRTILKALIETTFTNSMSRSYAVKSYPRTLAQTYHGGAPFSGQAYASLYKLLHYNERTQLDTTQDPWYIMERIDTQVARIAQPRIVDNSQVKETLKCLSEVRTRQLRRAMFAKAYKLLLVKAQWKEEARAQDPIKRCAACAVQAAKDQLVLGLEPRAKRQCV